MTRKLVSILLIFLSILPAYAQTPINIQKINGLPVTTGPGSATAGTLRVALSSDSSLSFSGNAAASNTGSAVPAAASYTGASVGGTLTGVTATNNGGKISLDVNLTGGSTGNAAAGTIGAAAPTSGDYMALSVGGTLRGVTGASRGGEFAMSVQVVDASGNQITSFGSGTVTANAGTNLNTSALALETGGNLATVATGVTALSARTADYDTGAGTSTMVMHGIALPASGGPVAGFTSTNPGLVTLTGTNSVRNQDGSGNNLTSAARGSERALSVQIVDGSGTQITSFGGSGGTASNYGSTFPSSGTAVGFSDGTNMQAARVIDADTGGGTIYVMASNLVSRGSGAISETGVAANPLQVSLANTGSNSTNVKVDVAAISAAATGAQAAADSDSVVCATDTRCIVAGAAADGAAVSGAPVRIAGKDGSGNTQDILTDTGGAVQVDIESAPSLTIGTFPDNEPINVAQINGVTVLMGNGASGTGAQRVTIANDSTGVLASIGSITTAITPGTGAANLGKAESGSAANADTGVVMLAMREDTPTGTAANGAYIVPKTDNVGRLYMNCASGCGGSGGSSIADGSGTFTPGTTEFTMVGGYRDDTSPDTAAEGEPAAARVTEFRAIHVNLRDASGNELSVGGGTQYDQGTATTATDKLTMAGAVRKDTAAVDAGVADGDRVQLSTDNAGRLRVTAADTTQPVSGTITVGTFPDNEPFNLAQVAGNTVLTGNGAVGNGALRVTIANDSTGILAQVTDVRQSTAANLNATTTRISSTAKYYISVGTSEDENEIKGTAGTLVGISARNAHATTNAFVKCTNLTAANTTPGSSTIFYEMMVPAGGGFVDNVIDTAFSTALTCYIVTGKAANDVAEVAADDVSYFIRYR